ncbi:MAG: hypothetical protein J0H34_15080, partial [Rhizobiales bacterium]|nr:hypothetical protein [Hyphomicrobiales bacterium]
ASGSGFDAARAIMACLGEAAEFASWRWREEDSRRILAGSGPAPLTKIDAKGQQHCREEARIHA